MRADGYVVRRGTGEYYLPEEPEVRLKLPDEERRTLRTEIKAIAHKLWASLGQFSPWGARCRCLMRARWRRGICRST
jgi:hypothetical protein